MDICYADGHGHLYNSRYIKLKRKMNHTLEIDSVILEFDRQRVLQDVYLKNETGTVTGILGRNGAGKSCLLNILYGVLAPNDKSIRINGSAVYKNTRDNNTMRYLPQFGFIPKFLTLKRIFKDFKLDFSEFTDDFPEFSKYYNTPIKKLSGGERRLVEVYIILLSSTKFCMLDEPFSHVMPVHVETIKSLILKEKEKKGIIVTDHMYSHIMDICDHIYLITKGKTHLIINPDQLADLGYLNLPVKA